MKYVDYYAALGVARDATLPAIKQAYRALAHLHHPDVSKAPGAEENFKAVAVAYATLKNPEKRAAYDALGVQRDGAEMDRPASPQHGFEFGGGMPDFEGMDFADLLHAMRQGGRTSTRPSRAALRGQDFYDTVQIELAQALLGGTLHLMLHQPVPGVTLEVKIPAGVQVGQQLRLAGKGGKGVRGGADGDVLLTVSFAPHPIFQVEAQALYFDLVLTPWEAALGVEVRVPTLEGEVL
ncbi:MAG: molecular chaperone DnaJ, partial [Burkholderiales bacterium PBB4]